MRCAIYARVSTIDQEPENQLQELRRYVEARGWTAVEYIDAGVSGAKERRPALDQLLADAKRRRFDVLVCLAARSAWAQSEAPDHAARRAAGARRSRSSRWPKGSTRRRRPASCRCTSSARSPSSSGHGSSSACGAGLARRMAQGKPLGRPRQTICRDDLARTATLSTRQAAAVLGVSHAAVHRARAVSKTPRTSIADCA